MANLIEYLLTVLHPIDSLGAIKYTLFPKAPKILQTYKIDGNPDGLFVVNFKNRALHFHATEDTSGVLVEIFRGGHTKS